MRIDADCHLADPSNGTGIGADELIRRLDEVNVDRAITWPMVSYTRDIAADNAAIYQAWRAHPERIISFGGVNPMLGLKVAQAELRCCIEEYGVWGVKLNGARDGYYVDDVRLALPLIEMIAEAGLVLAFHCGANDFERTHPYRIAKISAQFPDLRLMLVHMGGSGLPDIAEAVMDLASSHPNWYLIDSEVEYRKIHRALAQVGPERICYGSDTPFCPMRFEWGLRQVVYQDLEPAEREMVFGGNIARMLGIRA
ncbi:MAG: amidohydrolase [Chloroflexi bacterium]|nr:amidohydrolase [Chloroflexota bacterium]